MPGRSRRIWTGAVGALGVLAGVVALVTAGPASTPTATAAPTELLPFDDCEQVRASYVEAALPHVTAWGWDTSTPVVYDLPVAELRAASPSVDFGAVGNGATGTNLQEAGVDEPDLAKTDGTIVALIRHGDLVLFDASGDAPREIGRLDLPTGLHVTELLLVGDRAVLIGSAGDGTYFPGPTPFVPTGRIASTAPPPARTTVTTVDLTDPSSPSIVTSEVVDGTLVSARESDGVVRLVTTWTPPLDFVQPGRGQSLESAAKRNREIVRQTSVADWLPASRIDGGDPRPLLDCSDVRHPCSGPAGLGTISVLTIDPDEPGASEAIGVAADGDLTYASDDRLYVATADDGWTGWTWRTDGEPSHTDIHAFAIAGTDTTYVGSGQVPGRVPDRWAFSEHEGILRVASTVGPVWSPRETQVSALEEHDGALRSIGSVGGMGRREQIEAVRWFGELAVVVTFRQVDPLYTIDLSDPRHPTVVGELKIPGFSAYLHPIGDDLLLGVGQDATMRGSLRGSQVSTFDLGDLTQPRRLDLLGLGRTLTSAVESDSRAFTYLPSRRLAYLPTWSWRGGTSLEVAQVSEDGELGALTSMPLPGPSERVRVLPLDDGRVAIVADGDLIDLAEPPTG